MPARAARPPPPKRKPQAEIFEELARGLKHDGYSGGVVARKMIEEHKMEEAEASALVSRLYGKTVDPRGGDTTTEVVLGLGMAIGGVAGALALWFFMGLAAIRFTIVLYVLLIGLVGTGLAKAIKALINADVKEDLRR